MNFEFRKDDVETAHGSFGVALHKKFIFRRLMLVSGVLLSSIQLLLIVSSHFVASG